MFSIPTIDMVATGKNITVLRKQAGMSVKDIQDIFGFATPQAIYKWQHGTAIPTIDNLVILACVLHVTIDDLIVVKGAADRTIVDKGIAGMDSADMTA